jgi:uncharacterized membrane protein YeaQ/YmgE (transglycosylase-associated protein family)
MALYEIVMWVVLGLIAGWLAGSNMRGSGYGFAGDIAVAAVGAIAGVWLITFVLPEADRGGIVGSVIAGAVAAALFVVFARLLTRRTGMTRAPAISAKSSNQEGPSG